MNLLTAPLTISMKLLSKAVTAVVLVPLRPALKQIIHEEAGHYLKDIEWRYGQARALLNEFGHSDNSWATNVLGGIGRQMTAEDLDTLEHHLTGYTLTANNPTAGYISWASLHVVYAGTDYTVTDGSSNMKYQTFVLASAVAGVVPMASSNTKPTLATGDILLFINNSGTAVVAANDGSASLPTTVANGAIDTASLAVGAVTGSVIAAGGVGSGALGTGAISASAMFGAGVVNNASLGANAVLAGNINAGAVVAAALGAGAVTNAALGASAVQTSNINAGAVTTTQLGTGAVTATNIGAGAVTNAALGANAVQSTNILAGAVGSSALNAGAVTPAKLNVLDHLLY
jgi:hypothetical protein